MQITDEEDKELQNQEIWAKVFYDGYFYKLKDMMLCVQIQIPNPDANDSFKGTTQVFCPINADEDGKVDLTPLLHSFLAAMKKNPKSDVKAYATGFGRQFHFNKALLSTPIPQSLIDAFKIGKPCT
jgi:hypothetical protein